MNNLDKVVGGSGELMYSNTGRPMRSCRIRKGEEAFKGDNTVEEGPVAQRPRTRAYVRAEKKAEFEKRVVERTIVCEKLTEAGSDVVDVESDGFVCISIPVAGAGEGEVNVIDMEIRGPNGGRIDPLRVQAKAKAKDLGDKVVITTKIEIKKT